MKVEAEFLIKTDVFIHHQGQFFSPDSRFVYTTTDTNTHRNTYTNTHTYTHIQIHLINGTGKKTNTHTITF